MFKLKSFIIVVSISVACFVSYSFVIEKAPKSAPLTCREVISKMTKAIDEVKSLKYTLKVQERTKKGKMNDFGSRVKLNRKPRKLYLNAKGIEVLWVEGTNKGNALVNPHSFPYMNFNLDPMGSLMRQDQHHTINEMGFDYFGNIIDETVKKVDKDFDKIFKLESSDEMLNNRPCYKVTITNTAFKFVDYVVKKGETVTSIARKHNVAEFMIVERNAKIDDYDDVKEGQIIKVPSDYAKNVTIYIDKLYFLPIGSRIYDDKGLFEQYDYHSVLVNPKFADDEFTKDFKEYDF